LQQWEVQAVDLLLSKGLSANLLLYLAVEDNCVHVLSRLVETYGATEIVRSCAARGGFFCHNLTRHAFSDGGWNNQDDDDDDDYAHSLCYPLPLMTIRFEMASQR
jgi:hypothetical protein